MPALQTRRVTDKAGGHCQSQPETSVGRGKHLSPADGCSAILVPGLGLRFCSAYWRGDFARLT